VLDHRRHQRHGRLHQPASPTVGNATVGANRGDGVGYSRSAASAEQQRVYDGPFGNADGIFRYLDNRRFCHTGSNTSPPIPSTPRQRRPATVFAGETLSAPSPS